MAANRSTGVLFAILAAVCTATAACSNITVPGGGPEPGPPDGFFAGEVGSGGVGCTANGTGGLESFAAVDCAASVVLGQTGGYRTDVIIANVSGVCSRIASGRPLASATFVDLQINSDQMPAAGTWPLNTNVDGTVVVATLDPSDATCHGSPQFFTGGTVTLEQVTPFHIAGTYSLTTTTPDEVLSGSFEVDVCAITAPGDAC